jgi:hypothetical protein
MISNLNSFAFTVYLYVMTTSMPTMLSIKNAMDIWRMLDFFGLTALFLKYDSALHVCLLPALTSFHHQFDVTNEFDRDDVMA